MKNMKVKLPKRAAATCLVLFGCAISTAHAACVPEQRVVVEADSKQIAQWVGLSTNQHEVVLANNFKLGLKVEAASRERYETILAQTKQASFAELVKISLYDLTADKPRLMTTTYGGSNSLQGYGLKGGAARVDELGTSGITLRLLKPNCLSAAAIAAMPTAAMLGQTEEKIQPSAHHLRGQADAALAIASGKYVIAYARRQLSDAEIAVLKSEIETAGATFQLREANLPAADVSELG